jgi:hypothetical protein
VRFSLVARVRATGVVQRPTRATTTAPCRSHVDQFAYGRTPWSSGAREDVRNTQFTTHVSTLAPPGLYDERQDCPI